ncbi:3'-5' exonuclease [Pseudomonas sp. MS19]|uniref:3'-5' exonuclease n=1 Tax=Pseudomonas sp. MS19 TaxID=2579939 RepID=UPI0015627AD4|nr:3'-5' exonuclease [Pseudomonas sp. MS19]NRH29953.1 3'-5' exonuclease [Pseudomonas sp. MS19]
MNALTWLTGAKPSLDAEQQARVDALGKPAALDKTPLAEQRIVVLDLETSGLDTRRDQVLSIGAVVINQGAIVLGEQFECVVQRHDLKINASILIHGLRPFDIAAGIDPSEALLSFMEFLGDSPLLAFHANFDKRMLGRALKQTLGIKLRHPFLDVAEMAPLLCPDNAPRRGSLEAWAEQFGLQVHQRHHASADAMVTAELALIMFSKARQNGLDSLHQLTGALEGYRRRKQFHP